MKIVFPVGLSLILALGGVSGAGAHDPKASQPPTPPSSPTAAPGSPAAAVESFHSSLASGDREAAMSWLDPQVVVFESGGVEISREEYAAHHLESDMAFVGATKTEVAERRAVSSGDAAWVLTRSRTTGTFRDRPVDVDGVETMVLRRDEGRWTIVHIHWSSQQRKAD
jgi:ketosteroid isomerase-like protein